MSVMWRPPQGTFWVWLLECGKGGLDGGPTYTRSWDGMDQAFSQKWQILKKCSYQYFYSYIQNDTVTHFLRSLD